MERERRRLRPADFYIFNYPYYEPFKSEAGGLRTEQKYEEAIKKYTTVIGFNPFDSVSYAARAGCYERINDWKNGLEDAKTAIQLDPTSIPGHHQVIMCALRLHRFFDMERSVDILKKIDPTNPVLGHKSKLMNELNGHLANLKKAKANGKHTEAIKHIDECLGICPGLIMYKVQKAECLAGLRRFDEAEALTNEILEQDPNNSEAHYILARCLYETDVGGSVDHFNESFRLNPFCDKDQQSYLNGKRFLDKAATAIIASNQQKFAEAHEICRGMLGEDQTNQGMRGTLLFIMAEASYKLQKFDQCLQECAAVFNHIPDHLKTLILRAQCYRDQENYAESIADCEAALKIYPSAEGRRMLEEVKGLWAASKNRNMNLGVGYGAPANPEGQ